MRCSQAETKDLDSTTEEAPPTYGPVESPKAWSARRPGARPSIARAVVQPKLGGRCLFAHATWYVHLQLCRGLRRQAVEMPCCRQRWPVLQERATDYTHRDCLLPRLFFTSRGLHANSRRRCQEDQHPSHQASSTRRDHRRLPLRASRAGRARRLRNGDRVEIFACTQGSLSLQPPRPGPLPLRRKRALGASPGPLRFFCLGRDDSLLEFFSLG